MTVSTERDARQRAKSLGIPFAIVRNWYRELRQTARAAVEFEWSIRQQVWERYCYTPDCRDFWRHGMWVRFPDAFGEGDHDLIPGWDLCADELGWDSQELFDFIAADYSTLPSAGETWQQVIDQLETDDVQFATVTAGTDADDSPF